MATAQKLYNLNQSETDCLPPAQSDAQCLCTSEAFINTVAGCFGQQCDAANAATGTALGQQVSGLYARTD